MSNTPKPRFRTEAMLEIRSNIYNIVANSLEQCKPIYKSCMNCSNFDEKNELCLIYRERPPARIIAYGCIKWVDVEEIPF